MGPSEHCVQSYEAAAFLLDAVHGPAGARTLHPIDHRHVGLLLGHLRQRLLQEACAEHGIVQPRVTDEAVEGAPIGSDQPQREQHLSDRMVCGGAQVAQHQGAQAIDAASLAHAGAMGGEQPP
jgi:hypothetical protein